MAALTAPASPASAPAPTGLDAVWGCRFDRARTVLSAALARAAAMDSAGVGADHLSGDPENSPAVVHLRLALSDVVVAMLTGNKSDLAPALTSLDAARACAEQQRSKYQNMVSNVLDSVPVVGNVVDLFWSPLKRLGTAVTEGVGLSDEDTRVFEQKMVDAANAAEALGTFFRSIVLFASDRFVKGLVTLRAAYAAFLGIDADSACLFALDCRRFGVGIFAVILSFLPPALAATFNLASLSLGMSRDDGLAQLRVSHGQLARLKSMPTVFSTLTLAFAKIVISSSLGANEPQRRHRMLAEAQQYVDDLQAANPDSILAMWMRSHVVRRTGNYAEAANQMRMLLERVVPGVEGRPFVDVTRGGSAAGDSTSVSAAAGAAAGGGKSASGESKSGHGEPAPSGVIAYRPRLEYAQCLVIDLRWGSALRIMQPLISADSRFVAKGMALMLSAGAVSCLYLAEAAGAGVDAGEGGSDGDEGAAGVAGAGEERGGSGGASGAGGAAAVMRRVSADATYLQEMRATNDARAVRMYEEVLVLTKEFEDAGRMDAVLARKARVNLRRTFHELSSFELLYFWGHVGLSGRTYLVKLRNTLLPLRERVERHYAAAAAAQGAEGAELVAREELMSVCMLLGAVLQYLHEDAQSEACLDRVMEFSARDGYETFADPFHVPFTLFELGILYARTDRQADAVRVFKRALSLCDGFTFDQALAFRIKGPLKQLD